MVSISYQGVSQPLVPKEGSIWTYNGKPLSRENILMGLISHYGTIKEQNIPNRNWKVYSSFQIEVKHWFPWTQKSVPQAQRSFSKVAYTRTLYPIQSSFSYFLCGCVWGCVVTRVCGWSVGCGLWECVVFIFVFCFVFVFWFVVVVLFVCWGVCLFACCFALFCFVLFFVLFLFLLFVCLFVCVFVCLFICLFLFFRFLLQNISI